MIEIKHIDTALLKIHDRNPRKIDDADFEILKKSITDNPEYFQVRPILATPDMVVFAGNMRLRAALALGLDQVPVAFLDIPVEKQRELMIRDNVTNGTWDADILGADFEIAELQSWGYDPVGIGRKGGLNSEPEAPTDENQKWEYTCPDCGNKHVFTKGDLKPYVPEG